jgi:tetratricopeptide (TPR) repeat protein
LAFFYLSIADRYFMYDHKKANTCFDKALPIFIQSNDLFWQGKVYQRKGLLYSIFKSNNSALKMYEKALPLFVKTNKPISQGNVYIGKGIIYYKTGDNPRALEIKDVQQGTEFL